MVAVVAIFKDIIVCHRVCRSTTFILHIICTEYINISVLKFKSILKILETTFNIKIFLISTLIIKITIYAVFIKFRFIKFC